VSRLFAGIQGVTIPKTVRVRERDPVEVKKILHDAGFDYPVLVRIAGSHLGMNLIRVDTPEGLDAIRGLDRTDRASLYVTEFFNFVSPDNRYRKFRVVVIGDDIFLRHCIIAEHWMIEYRRGGALNVHDVRSRLEGASPTGLSRDGRAAWSRLFRDRLQHR
jgi:hypothetical protein